MSNPPATARCPRCGGEHEVEQVAGATIVPCPSQPLGIVTAIDRSRFDVDLEVLARTLRESHALAPTGTFAASLDRERTDVVERVRRDVFASLEEERWSTPPHVFVSPTTYAAMARELGPERFQRDDAVDAFEFRITEHLNLATASPGFNTRVILGELPAGRLVQLQEMYANGVIDRRTLLQYLDWPDVVHPPAACVGCGQVGEWGRSRWARSRWWRGSHGDRPSVVVTEIAMICDAWPACIRCLEHDDCRETAGLPVDEPQGLALSPRMGIECAEKSGLRARKGQPIHRKRPRGAARRREAMADP